MLTWDLTDALFVVVVLTYKSQESNISEDIKAMCADDQDPNRPTTSQLVPWKLGNDTLQTYGDSQAADSQETARWKRCFQQEKQVRYLPWFLLPVWVLLQVRVLLVLKKTWGRLIGRKSWCVVHLEIWHTNTRSCSNRGRSFIRSNPKDLPPNRMEPSRMTKTSSRIFRPRWKFTMSPFQSSANRWWSCGSRLTSSRLPVPVLSWS